MSYAIICRRLMCSPRLYQLSSSFRRGNRFYSSLILREVCEAVSGSVGGLDELEVVLDQFRVNLTPIVVTEVIGVCRNDAPTRRLLRFIMWSRKVLKSAFTDEDFNLSLRVLAERKDLVGIEVLLWDMAKESRVLNQCTFAVVVDALVKLGREDEALGVFKNLEKFQCPKDGDSVMAIITSLCKKGHARKAQGVLHHHKDKISAMELKNIFKSILYGFAVKKKVKEAKTILKEMKKNGITPDIFCYNTFFKGLCQRNAMRNPSGLVPDAMNVLMEMRSYRVEPNSITYNTLLSYLGRVGRVKEACKVLDLMKKSGCNPTWVSYYYVIKVLYASGRFGKGKKLVDEMTDMGLVPNIKFFSDLITILCKSGRMKLALELLDRAKGCSLAGCELLYDIIIPKLYREGEVEVGNQLRDEALATGLSLTYTELLE